MTPHSVEILALVFFVGAILHTFVAGSVRKFAHKFPAGSPAENLFHLLGEVEVVFGIWAGFLFVAMVLIQDMPSAIAYVDALDFTEPLFVFVIMAMAATRPVVESARRFIEVLARIVPLPRRPAIYVVSLVIGPLLGSLITEPAAMTVTALLLKDEFFGPKKSDRFKYFTLAVLFVNVSIGGALTPYAAPPILMVAGKCGWVLAFRFFRNLGFPLV